VIPGRGPVIRCFWRDRRPGPPRVGPVTQPQEHAGPYPEDWEGATLEDDDRVRFDPDGPARPILVPWTHFQMMWETHQPASQAHPEAGAAFENSVPAGHQDALLGIRTTTDESAEAECGKWIAGLTARPRNKETAFETAKAAVANIGQLSRKAFDRAWAIQAPRDWKNPGRRKGS
jgi:hypothetical protein